MARRTGGRWGQKVVEWRSRIVKQSLGRPPMKWKDYLIKAVYSKWMQTASNRGKGGLYDNNDDIVSLRFIILY